MIKVDMWELVRDWVAERYLYVKVSKFKPDYAASPVNHLGHITSQRPGEQLVEIGFIAPKGVLVWRPHDPNSKETRKFEYKMFLSTDPEMFEKLDEMLRLYEPKRTK